MVRQKPLFFDNHYPRGVNWSLFMNLGRLMVNIQSRCDKPNRILVKKNNPTYGIRIGYICNNGS